jgi:hypothetical protein
MVAAGHRIAAVVGAGVVVAAGVDDGGGERGLEGGPASPLAITLIDGAARGIDQTAMTHDLEVTLRIAAVAGRVGARIAIFAGLNRAIATRRERAVE